MAEPLTVLQAKQQLNIPAADTTFDALLTAYITAARAYVEGRGDHILVEREFIEYRPAFGSYIELTRRPIISVDEIGYTDTDDAAQTYAGFVVDVNRHPVRVHPALSGAWPSIQTNSLVAVTYTGGYEAADLLTEDAPIKLIQAMRLLLAHWFAYRETAQGGNLAEIPHGVDALCDQVRGVLL